MPQSKPSPLKSKLSLKSELCPQIYAHFFWDFELRTEMRDLKCWWLWSLNTFVFNLGWCCCLLNFKYIDKYSICIWRWSLYLLASCCFFILDCQHNGKFYPAGRQFRSGDGCNDCTCLNDGTFTCTDFPCYPGKCFTPVVCLLVYFDMF